MIAARLGLRNLARNRWRSGLTLAAIAVSVALMVWTLAFYEGWIAQMVRGATATEIGQIQVQTLAYIEAPRVYRTFARNPAAIDAIRALPDVVAVSPRVEMFGLMGNEERSQVVRIMGVDPDLEVATTPVADGITTGRWLRSAAFDPTRPREVVLGEGVARQLRVTPGDTLAVFLEAADGSLGNDLILVVGVVRTGNTQVDRMTAYMPLDDAQYLAALDGQIHELAIRTRDLEHTRATAAGIATALGARLGEPPDGSNEPGDELIVRPWQDIVPAINQMIILFRRSYWIMYLLVYLVAAVGILNTQRMSALERHREFGVMMAIGMRPRRMFRTLQTETAVLAILGAAAGAAGGGLLSWYHATAGLNLALFTDQASFSYMGVAFSDRIFFQISAGNVLTPVVIMVLVAFVCGLWPAVRAARIDPAPTIAGRT